MSAGSRLALAGLVVAAVAVIAVAGMLALGPRSVAAPLNESQALVVAREFAPVDHALTLSRTDVAGARHLYEFGSPDVTVTVDADSGQVVTFLDTRAMPASSSVAISPNQASAAASAFLAFHGIPTDGLEATVELLDHGESSEYQVRFVGRVNGARTPNVRDVSVDPGTGRVCGFVRVDHSPAPPPAPRLTAEDALAVARRLVDDPLAKSTSTDLLIAFDGTGTQQLAWELHLTLADGFFAIVQVDALTGAGTITGRG